MIVFDLDYENTEYGYRMDGPFDPETATASIARRSCSIRTPGPSAAASLGRAAGLEQRLPAPRRAWSTTTSTGTTTIRSKSPMEDLVIYEMHVRGFTRHPSSGVKFPGTFAGIREKIPYLKELGVNCVELMPIYEFDEWENSHTHPETGEQLCNYWGYSTVGFFAPEGRLSPPPGKLGMQVDELKALVKELHRNGIEVILDVVFNHTAEGNEYGPYISFKGIDNKTYYMLTPEGYYFNFSGTGNTLNCNNPVVRNMVLDCLRYWASEYHIDGFRFDLASILGRDPFGRAAVEPAAARVAGLRPDPGQVQADRRGVGCGRPVPGRLVPGLRALGRVERQVSRRRAQVPEGRAGHGRRHGASACRARPTSTPARGPTASINFITAHDGFTLNDLVSYNDKHNEANGEDNRDGANDNDSWNCGWEGPTDDPGINALRRRQIKNALAMLLVSQGVPMILMGDEVGRTQDGNNNAYCHDNELSWLDWGLRRGERRPVPLHQRADRLPPRASGAAQPLASQRPGLVGSGYPDISWHGTAAWQPDWSGSSRTLAFMLSGKNARGGAVQDDFVYVAMNTHWDGHWFELPQLPDGHAVARGRQHRRAVPRRTRGRPGRNRAWTTRAASWWATDRWSSWSASRSHAPALRHAWRSPYQKGVSSMAFHMLHPRPRTALPSSPSRASWMRRRPNEFQAADRAGCGEPPEAAGADHGRADLHGQRGSAHPGLRQAEDGRRRGHLRHRRAGHRAGNPGDDRLPAQRHHARAVRRSRDRSDLGEVRNETSHCPGNAGLSRLSSASTSGSQPPMLG